ncbi:MAG: phospho-sugar mutase [Acidimicrobiia bacterium]|nr:phospho-sugar mutase [Acidimicrobiia bacterium]
MSLDEKSREELYSAAAQWIDGDPDPATREEMERFVAAESDEELADRLGARLQFGTAGLRGAVGAGPNRMNRSVVIQATRGLAVHLLNQGGGTVVVGYDARLSSRQFMEDTVGVLAAAGLTVRYFDVPTPTPLVAFAALRFDAIAAVVVTASHNPPQDNGYKVYAANGAQIVPPDDILIAAEIDKVGPAALVPRIRWSATADSDLCSSLDAGPVFEQYLEAVHRPRPDTDRQPLRIVYTPLHGVGGYFTQAVLEYGGNEVVPVLTQSEPDGRFPTVDFPNPEEPGALDEAFAIAERDDSFDLIVANDPDADRLSVSVPSESGWRALSGNQVGVLLADWCLDGGSASPAVFNSVVSSPMLGSIAAARGALWATTLTGFKWIWNAALDLAPEYEFIMGYEEALGYSVGPAVRDKDGISTALVFADMAGAAKAQGSTVLDRLAGLYREVGIWTSAQHSVRFEGAGGMDKIEPALNALLDDPPTELAGIAVTGIKDYRTGAEDRPRYLGATPLLELDLGDSGRCLIRPSGTEPKLKIYVDLTEPTDLESTTEIMAAEAELQARGLIVAQAAAVALGFSPPA